MSALASCLLAARTLLDMSQAEVEAHTNIERRVVGAIETGKFKLVPREAFRLQSLYEKQGVEFVSETSSGPYGIRWKIPGRFDPFRSAQFRAARAMLGLSQRELAATSGVDKSFIARLEKDKPKALSMDTVQKLVTFLQRAGVELTPESEDFGAGVLLKSKTGLTGLDRV